MSKARVSHLAEEDGRVLDQVCIRQRVHPRDHLTFVTIAQQGDLQTSEHVQFEATQVACATAGSLFLGFGVDCACEGRVVSDGAQTTTDLKRPKKPVDLTYTGQ